MPNQHAHNNQRIIGIRARDEWIVRLDAAARAAGQSRMAYIRQAIEERMAREQRKEISGE
ncbi:hypothetical protein BXT84_00655 [Sulfobacillus thermotolerans]|uniref:Ribbon-helix-helix protein CopG domain-containing protein n=1 Tax=Sulfobacillus thermotolerans TaxID=338644 RepID=A0ABN5GWE0_9FIRM|nr:hypothetical protein BXT84_00655 [Sulfobacillus thermotolerans]